MNKKIKVLCILILIALSIMACKILIFKPGASGSKEQIYIFEEQGINIIEDFVEVVDFEHFGSVRFIPYLYKGDFNTRKLSIAIAKSNNEIIYYLPEFTVQNLNMDSIKEVIFEDINNDCLLQLIF